MRSLRLLCFAGVIEIGLVLIACKGPAGPPGAMGRVGERGVRGDPGTPGETGARGQQGVQGPAGEGPAPMVALPLEPRGIVGVVRDPSGQVVPLGNVFLVPSADVGALARQPIDLSRLPEDVASLDSDEPLEDLLDKKASSYIGAPVSSDGSYDIPQVPAGTYFLVWRPDGNDTDHLPGGSHCRKALDSASLVGTRVDILVSGRPSANATYVGSSGCFDCHERERTVRTAHRVGLSVPGVRGAFQDTTPWPFFDAGISAFTRGTTLYYFDCDPTRKGEAKCSVSDTDPTIKSPSAIVSFELELARDITISRTDVGAFTITLVNRSGTGKASYPIALTYGGALTKQRYLTRRMNPNGRFSYYFLPLQYNIAGSDANLSPDDWSWKDEHSEQWYDFARSTLAEPGNELAFDNGCAGCHFTGMRLDGDRSAGFTARAAAEVNGDFDYDGDNRREEINIGCETCHGPGSEHVEASVRGLHIVSPSLLTSERETLICGRCHSRPAGLGGGATETPLSIDGHMAMPGLRRSEYVTAFTSRVDAAPEDLHPGGDSKSNHQQYTDFIRSTMYRNPSSLMTCGNCHDPHGNDQNPHELRNPASDNSACIGCHSGPDFTAPRGHIGKVTQEPHQNVDDSLLLCTACHMVKTAVSAVRHPELLDSIPASAMPVQYFHGDTASHRFAVTRRNQYAAQPVAATLQCAFCHGTEFPNP